MELLEKEFPNFTMFSDKEKCDSINKKLQSIISFTQRVKQNKFSGSPILLNLIDMKQLSKKMPKLIDIKKENSVSKTKISHTDMYDSDFNIDSMNIDQLILGYYTICTIINAIHSKILFKLNENKMIHDIHTYLEYTSGSHLVNLFEDQHLRFYNETVDRIKEYFRYLKLYIPDINELFSLSIDLYLQLREIKKNFLPDLNSLVVSGNLHIVNRVHGSINSRSLNTFTNPSIVYRIAQGLSSVCAIWDNKYIDFLNKIQIMLQVKYKNTLRNNKKKIEEITKKIIADLKGQNKEIKTHLIDGKIISNAWTPFRIQRYLGSQQHIYEFQSGKEIISKSYVACVIGNNSDDLIYTCGITKDTIVNLIDYLDIEPIRFNNSLSWEFNTKQIFDLFKGIDIKFILFVDLACASDEIINAAENHIEGNRLVKIGKNMEGESITNKIITKNNSSPYNVSPNRNRTPTNKRLNKSRKNSASRKND